MALSANKTFDFYKRGTSYSVPVASGVKLYQGAIVCIDSSGYATTAAAASGNRPAGIAVYQADNSAGTSGAINVLVEKGCGVYYANGSAAIADQEVPVYATADDTFTTTSGTSGRFGVIKKVVLSTAWYIELD